MRLFLKGSSPPERMSIGSVARRALLNGKTNEEVLEIIGAVFPGAKTTIACIRWYRNQMRRKGYPVPTAREVKRRRRGHLRPVG